MTKEMWTDEDELEFKIGDMNGIAFTDKKNEDRKKMRKVRIKWKKIWKEQSGGGQKNIKDKKIPSKDK